MRTSTHTRHLRATTRLHRRERSARHVTGIFESTLSYMMTIFTAKERKPLPKSVVPVKKPLCEQLKELNPVNKIKHVLKKHGYMPPDSIANASLSLNVMAASPDFPFKRLYHVLHEVDSDDRIWPHMFTPDLDLPYPRNKHFRGRETELAMLEAQLRPRERPVGLQQVAIVGPAGHGKTSLALEFAYRHKTCKSGSWEAFKEAGGWLGYDKVFWIDCTSKDTARLSFAQNLGKSGYGDTLSRTGLLSLKASLRCDSIPELNGSMSSKFLLVFDNVRHVPIVRKLWPLEGTWGSVIVITEDERIGRAFAPKKDPFEYQFKDFDNPRFKSRMEAAYVLSKKREWLNQGGEIKQRAEELHEGFMSIYGPGGALNTDS